MSSWYDAWADRYEEWSTGVTGDVPFYVGLAREAEGPLVELAIGTGRVAIPIARATGRRVVGIDSSPAMLAQARDRAAEAGVELESLRLSAAATVALQDQYLPQVVDELRFIGSGMQAQFEALARIEDTPSPARCSSPPQSRIRLRAPGSHSRGRHTNSRASPACGTSTLSSTDRKHRQSLATLSPFH
jgi:SAM-dependent methyltransferase